MQQQASVKAEFSRPLALEGIGLEPLVETIAANLEERRALAKRFGLLSLDRLEARLEVWRDGVLPLVHVRGQLSAELAQACVVTLAPVAAQVAECVDLLYSTQEDCGQGGGDEILIDPDEVDPPEPIGPEGIDLGEAVAQQLLLALDPYPRAEGADVTQLEWTGSEPGEESTHPFAILRRLGRKG